MLILIKNNSTIIADKVMNNGKLTMDKYMFMGYT